MASSFRVHSDEAWTIDEENEPATDKKLDGKDDTLDIPKVKFTVTPVKIDIVVSDHGETSKAVNNVHQMETLEFSEGENTDTYHTQNSITALLSSKFRDIHNRIKQYGMSQDSTRYRKRLVSKWESLNYDPVENELSSKEHEQRSKSKIKKKWLVRWLLMFLTGVGTAIIASGIQITVDFAGHYKFLVLQEYLDHCAKESCFHIPVLIWVTINMVGSLLGASLVTFLQPVAAGSGIPLIKSYLNGVEIPGLLSLKALVAKAVGVVLSILGGLACGKEGPMIHSGAIVAAGLAHGRVRLWNKELKLFDFFHNDHELRDFVSGGAASGVSAAFGAPVGGTLFSVEEAASFWNQGLTWRVFFAAMIATFTVNFILSIVHGDLSKMSSPGLVRFNLFPELLFDPVEIPVFFAMAAVGGLLGALFIVINYRLTIFREKFSKYRCLRVFEASFVAVVSGLAAIVMIYTINDCTTVQPYNNASVVSHMYCEAGSHNAVSAIFLRTPEACLIGLLHDPPGSYSVLTLGVFLLVFFLLGVWTYGLSISSGIFIPSLIIGATWGRLVGIGIGQLFPYLEVDLGKYALIGAASQLGGIVRTTISLTVILVECTGNISFGLPIMLVLIVSKWVGDFLSSGIYEMNIHVSGIPLLPWDPPPLCENLKAREIMSKPLTVFHPIETVGHVIDILSSETSNGYPVVDPSRNRLQVTNIEISGKLKGLILRSDIMLLLKHKNFSPHGQPQPTGLKLEDFRKADQANIQIKDLNISEEEKSHILDLRPYMMSAPYTIQMECSMSRVFKLFRGLGLRHLVVVNDKYEAVGMVTRKDIAKFRTDVRRGILKMKTLTIENV